MQSPLLCKVWHTQFLLLHQQYYVNVAGLLVHVFMLYCMTWPYCKIKVCSMIVTSKHPKPGTCMHSKQEYFVADSLQAWDVSTDWPGVRPLYYTTLAQLGLVYNPGVPSLVDYLLPLRSGKLVRGVIRGILRDSPPYDVAAATRRVVRSLGELVCWQVWCQRGHF